MLADVTSCIDVLLTSLAMGSSLGAEATVSIADTAGDRGGFSGGFVSAGAGWLEAESGRTTAGVVVVAVVVVAAVAAAAAC